MGNEQSYPGDLPDGEDYFFDLYDRIQGPDHESYLIPRPFPANKHMIYGPFISSSDNRKFVFKQHPFRTASNKWGLNTDFHIQPYGGKCVTIKQAPNRVGNAIPRYPALEFFAEDGNELIAMLSLEKTEGQDLPICVIYTPDQVAGVSPITVEGKELHPVAEITCAAYDLYNRSRVHVKQVNFPNNMSPRSPTSKVKASTPAMGIIYVALTASPKEENIIVMDRTEDMKHGGPCIMFEPVSSDSSPRNRGRGSPRVGSPRIKKKFSNLSDLDDEWWTIPGCTSIQCCRTSMNIIAADDPTPINRNRSDSDVGIMAKSEDRRIIVAPGVDPMVMFALSAYTDFLAENYKTRRG